MVKDWPLRELLAMVEARRPFTVSRWGKGEWRALFGERNGFVPKDSYRYFDGLCRDLASVLTSLPPYRLSIPSDALEVLGPRIDDYLKGTEGFAGLRWCRDAFKIETPEQLQAVVGAASRVPLVVVGPPRLRRLRRLLRPLAFVDVPPRNQYLCKDDLVREVLAHLEGRKSAALVTVDAGVTGPLLIDELFRRLGGRHQLADVGTLWEPFAGQ
jgi:hypothetical protein